MQDLENNWINLDSLRNIYEIYANLIVTTLFNLKHFLITRAQLCLQGTFVKASLMFVTIFLDIYKNPRRKTINPPCPKHCKLINQNKKWHKVLFLHFFVVPQGFILLRHTKKVKIKNVCCFSPLFRIVLTRFKTEFFVKLLIYVISFSLTIEIHNKNIDNSKVTNKQYYNIILF